MARSLNRVQLIGNLTRDPELRYTPAGTAVASFSIATNRSWKTDTGELKEEAEFHRIVAWNKLAEICANILKKGRKVFVEGRLQTRTWQAQDGQNKQTVEIVISDMMALDSKGADASGSGEETLDVPADFGEGEVPVEATSAPTAKAVKSVKKVAKSEPAGDDDMPF